ncbi:MAG: phenylpyruvate tautomerase MIF-related protein [bacterium]|nr:phenylpyruvate tautomerase MIF-related protein [bacterium]MDD6225028.1 phenylpyruvate tautomerase MIF-related protein [bacterium]MDY3861634.1 phenylpyruvate tautomerase MIF-related protein [Ruminococcus sp.]
MPFINVYVSKDLNNQEITAVKSRLGKAISVFPGKSESYLMVNITPKCNLFFGGKNDKDCAVAEVKLFGGVVPQYSEKFTEEFCKIMQEELKIAGDKTYVTYQGIENWGFNGRNF